MGWGGAGPGGGAWEGERPGPEGGGVAGRARAGPVQGRARWEQRGAEPGAGAGPGASGCDL